MSIYFDLGLKNLQEKNARKKRLTSMLADLNEQNIAITENVRLLKLSTDKEQHDVDRLEKNKLLSFFYEVIAKKDEKITKEKAEAYAAAIKYDNAVKQLNDINCETENLKSELKSLGNCEEEYKKMLSEKIKWMKENGSAYTDIICKCEENIGDINCRLKEIDEALVCGKKVQNQVALIEKELNSAEGWGNWDLLGGGFIADAIKHSHLDTAEEKIQELQKMLGGFRTELADVTITADFKVQIDGFLRFADYFFDGFIADLSVLERIDTSQKNLAETGKQVCDLMKKLYALRSEAEDNLSKVNTELEKTALEAI